MEDLARQRRERLKAIQALAQASENDVIDEKSANIEDQKPSTVRKRVRSEENDDDKDQQQSRDQEELLNLANENTIEGKARELNQAVRQELEEQRQAEVDIMNLAPRKIDWDLKRDVEQQLQKLERQTKRKIAELIRLRLKEQRGDGDNLLDAVNAARANDQNSDKEDE